MKWVAKLLVIEAGDKLFSTIGTHYNRIRMGVQASLPHS